MKIVTLLTERGEYRHINPDHIAQVSPGGTRERPTILLYMSSATNNCHGMVYLASMDELTELANDGERISISEAAQEQLKIDKAKAAATKTP